MQPDAITHYKKLARQVIEDLGNGFGQVVDIQALAYPIGMYAAGVDLSYWQGTVDFAKLASKIQFAYLRAGYGNDFTDPRLNEYREGCKAHGIRYGLYWYAKPRKAKNWEAHADNFFKVWCSDPGDLPPCFDLEESGGLSKTELDSWLMKMYNRFCAAAHLEYKDVMTYTRASFLDYAMGLTNWLKWTQLWVAHWGTVYPKLPQEWAFPLQNSGNPVFNWDVHQYSGTGKGSDYGCSSRYVDLDRGVFNIPVPPGGDDLKMRVTADVLNVRTGPGTTFTDVGDLHEGDVIDLLNVGGAGAWVQIRGGEFDGKWVCVQLSSARYCEPVE